MNMVQQCESLPHVRQIVRHCIDVPILRLSEKAR